MTSGVSVGGPSVCSTRGFAPEREELPVAVSGLASVKGDDVVTPINGERRVWKVAAVPGDGDLTRRLPPQGLEGREGLHGVQSSPPLT